MALERTKLRDWLRSERRSQAWLATEIGGVHQTSVSSWIRGTPMPLSAALRIHRVTGIPIEDLEPEDTSDRGSGATIPQSDESTGTDDS